MKKLTLCLARKTHPKSTAMSRLQWQSRASTFMLAMTRCGTLLRTSSHLLKKPKRSNLHRNHLSWVQLRFQLMGLSAPKGSTKNLRSSCLKTLTISTNKSSQGSTSVPKKMEAIVTRSLKAVQRKNT